MSANSLRNIWYVYSPQCRRSAWTKILSNKDFVENLTSLTRRWRGMRILIYIKENSTNQLEDSAKLTWKRNVYVTILCMSYQKECCSKLLMVTEWPQLLCDCNLSESEVLRLSSRSKDMRVCNENKTNMTQSRHIKVQLNRVHLTSSHVCIITHTSRVRVLAKYQSSVNSLFIPCAAFRAAFRGESSTATIINNRHSSLRRCFCLRKSGMMTH